MLRKFLTSKAKDSDPPLILRSKMIVNRTLTLVLSLCAICFYGSLFYGFSYESYREENKVRDLAESLYVAATTAVELGSTGFDQSSEEILKKSDAIVSISLYDGEEQISFVGRRDISDIRTGRHSFNVLEKDIVSRNIEIHDVVDADLYVATPIIIIVTDESGLFFTLKRIILVIVFGLVFTAIFGFYLRRYLFREIESRLSPIAKAGESEKSLITQSQLVSVEQNLLYQYYFNLRLGILKSNWEKTETGLELLESTPDATGRMAVISNIKKRMQENREIAETIENDNSQFNMLSSPGLAGKSMLNIIQLVSTSLREHLINRNIDLDIIPSGECNVPLNNYEPVSILISKIVMWSIRHTECGMISLSAHCFRLDDTSINISIQIIDDGSGLLDVSDQYRPSSFPLTNH